MDYGKRKLDGASAKFSYQQKTNKGQLTRYPHESESLIFMGLVQQTAELNQIQSSLERTDTFSPSGKSQVSTQTDATRKPLMAMESSSTDSCSTLTDVEMYSLENTTPNEPHPEGVFKVADMETDSYDSANNGETLDSVSISTMCEASTSGSRQQSNDQIKQHVEKYDFYS
ncbi:hypothetical protein RP20_CCG019017 [Aedes albopictus]|nr:hypothetical protein RP20_CCG019017 [Aedes albopictus]